MKLPSFVSRRPPLTQPIETGTVRWQRDLDAALAESERQGRPVFALFQEVPGCAGCQQFGADVLSDPLVVEAIETEFVPLLIHNNAEGPDAEVLARYGEPAWNYQVVRFLGADGVDLLPRRDRVWETGPLLTRMVAALRAAGQAVPDHLLLLEQEHSDRLEELVLSQGCFWVGESQLGQIEGVVTTEAGFLDTAEVTVVRYDPERISREELVADATRRGVASAVFDRSAGRYRRAPESDQKRQLGGGSTLGFTAAQLTKRNGFLRTSATSADRFVFPSQR